MVKVTRAVRRPANVGLVGRERESRDGSPMATTSIRSNPRRALLQGIDILLGERVAFLVDLAHRGPRVVEFSGGREVASDGNKSADKTGKNGNTEESERRRVGDHSNEQARDIRTGKNTCIG
jgi:hypothetical protein